MVKEIIGWEPEYQRSLDELLLGTGKIKKGTDLFSVDLTTPLLKYKRGGKSRLELKTPLLSAAMQAVTGPRMVMEMAKIGGVGLIYWSQLPKEEAEMVREVKRHKAGFVVPDVFSLEDSLELVQKTIDVKGYSTFPITNNGRPNDELIGYLTENDFYLGKHKGLKVKDRMIGLKDIVFARLDDILDNEGREDLNKANDFLLESHHGSLPIVDNKMRLRYVVFRRDARENLEKPWQLLDEKKRLVCGAAINTYDYEERVPLLIEAGADFLAIVTSQALSDYVEDTLEYMEDTNPDFPVLTGNVIDGEGFNFLAENGTDAVLAGMGSSRICSTKEQIRVGSGQANAVRAVAKARDKWLEKTDQYIPIISDGGVKTSGDITTALALGADAVMVGGYIIGTEESNSELLTRIINVNGVPVGYSHKEYWGEGSERAKAWSPMRYGHELFEEGFVTEVPYVGSLTPYLLESLAKVREGMRKAGCYTIDELHKNSVIKVVSEVSRKESEEKFSRIRGKIPTK